MIPLDCLSLAANALQFVDFTIRLVAKSNHIARSADGRLAEHTDLYVVSSDLTDLKTKLRESKQILSIHTSLTEDDWALIKLSDGCLEAAKELQQALDELRCDGKPTKWRSVRQALKTVWKKEHIDSLYKRLSMYRSQLDSRALAGIASRVELIRTQQAGGLEQLSQEIRTANDALQSNMTETQEQVVEAIAGTNGETRQYVKELKDQLDQLAVSDQHAHIENVALQTQIHTAVSSAEMNVRSEQQQLTAKLSRQLENAENQIVQLRQDIQNIQQTIAETIKQGIQKAGNGHRQEQKKSFDEYLKGLYALWAAKEMLLQELVNFVNAAKKLVSREWSSIKLLACKVVPNDRSPKSTVPVADPSETDLNIPSGVHPCALVLFEAIGDGNLEWLQSNESWHPYVNSRMERQCLVVGKKAPSPYYRDLSGSFSLKPRRYYQLRTNMTPLIFAVNLLACSLTRMPPSMKSHAVWGHTRHARKIIERLFAAGADKDLQDGSGSSAWHHALASGIESFLFDLFHERPKNLATSIEEALSVAAQPADDPDRLRSELDIAASTSSQGHHSLPAPMPREVGSSRIVRAGSPSRSHAQMPANLVGTSQHDSLSTIPEEYRWGGMAICSYEADPDKPNEISLYENEILSVIHNDGTWQQVKKSNGETGIVPASHISVFDRLLKNIDYRARKGIVQSYFE